MTPHPNPSPILVQGSYATVRLVGFSLGGLVALEALAHVHTDQQRRRQQQWRRQHDDNTADVRELNDCNSGLTANTYVAVDDDDDDDDDDDTVSDAAAASICGVSGAGKVELHLCGAAVTSTHAKHLLGALPAPTVIRVYHASTDNVLSVFFAFAEVHPLICAVRVGCVELVGEVTCIGTSS